MKIFKAWRGQTSITLLIWNKYLLFLFWHWTGKELLLEKRIEPNKDAWKTIFHLGKRP